MTPETPLDPDVRELRLLERPVTYTDDHTLAAADSTGPTFVLVHGLPGSVRDYRWLGAALRDTGRAARVVRLDMPGFGGTDVSLGGDMSVAARADFVAQVLAHPALGIDRCVLAGHSMGGAVVLAATALASQRVAGMALLASVGLTPHKGYKAMPFPHIAAKLSHYALGRKLIGGTIRRTFIRGGFPASTPLMEMFYSLRCASALRFEHVQTLTLPLLQEPRKPALIATAEDDALVEPEIAEALHARFGGELLVFATGGHNIQKTRAVELAEALFRLAGATATEPINSTQEPLDTPA